MKTPLLLKLSIGIVLIACLTVSYCIGFNVGRSIGYYNEAERYLNETERLLAITYIEESKYSHQVFLNNPHYDVFQDPKFHQRCVNEYNLVLKVLERK